MPVDVGHRDVVRPVDLADVVHRADVGMPQRGGGPGLAVKPLEQFGRRLLLEVRRLEGDLPLELRVLGQVDHAHRALAQSLDDAVTAELLLEAARLRTVDAWALRGDRLLSVHGERLRRRAFPLARLSQLADLVLRIDERPQLVGDLGTLGEELLAIDGVAAIDSLEVLLEGNLQLIVGRLGPDGRALRPIRFCRPRVVGPVDSSQITIFLASSITRTLSINGPAKGSRLSRVYNSNVVLFATAVNSNVLVGPIRFFHDFVLVSAVNTILLAAAVTPIFLTTCLA